MNRQDLDISSPEGLVDALLTEGVTLAGIKGITEEELEAVYALAHEDLAEGRTDAALDGLTFLVRHNPWEARFQYSLALCLQTLGQHQAAGTHYGQALLLDATDAACAFRLGECLVALDDLEGAREAFDSAVKLSWLQPEGHEVRGLAEQALDRLIQTGR